MDIADLDLSIRAFNLVCRAGIRTIPELFKKYQCDIEWMQRNVGRKHTAEIGAALAKHREEAWKECHKMEKNTAIAPKNGAEQGAITPTEQEQAEALHNQITGYSKMVYQSLYGMCTAIKQMRDSKLYRALGFSTFEAYTEEKLGMKRRQAYNYIQIADQLTEDFVQPVAQIGMRKLLMLAALTEDQREEIVETTDLTETTVKELKAQIAQLTADRDAIAADRQREGIRADRLARELQDKDEEIEELEDRISAQEEQIDELESRPVEVITPEPSREVQNMQDAMRRINLEHEQWSAQIQDEHIKQVQAIHAKHREETAALRAEYEEKLAAAQAAPTETPEPDSKEVFKAYLANVIDAAKRMTAFLQAHPNEVCRKQAEKFFQTMIGEVST